MLKRTYLLGLGSIAVLGFVSLPVRAEQINTQVTNQSAATVGSYNQIGQSSTEVSVQQQQRSLFPIPSRQDNLQSVQQNGGAVGIENRIRQDSQQVNVQRNLANPYFPH